MPLLSGQPLYLSLQHVSAQGEAAPDLNIYREVTAVRPGAERRPPAFKLAPVYPAADLPRQFGSTEAHFTALRTRVTVDTPDPFLNAAVGALNVAADALWDEPQQRPSCTGPSPGASRLLGWRGPRCARRTGGGMIGPGSNADY